MPIRFFCNQCGKEIFQNRDMNEVVNLGEFEREQLFCSDCLVDKGKGMDTPAKRFNALVLVNIGGKPYECSIDGQELFCTFLYRAAREGRDPAQTVIDLAELASQNINLLRKTNPFFCKNRLGEKV